MEGERVSIYRGSSNETEGSAYRGSSPTIREGSAYRGSSPTISEGSAYRGSSPTIREGSPYAHRPMSGMLLGDCLGRVLRDR
jgi:hypothetical protein